MAGLLVSVRSVAEASAAWRGGATVIDIKDPDRGPLGRAATATWHAVRAAVPAHIPVSVALGELIDLEPGTIKAGDLAGITFQKAGPAGLGANWAARWDEARGASPTATGWVAVAYADASSARAPDPDQVITTALRAPDCPGVLIDTWDKSRPCPIRVDARWRERVQRVQESGRFIALAGRLDLATIGRLLPLAPDLFAVRGAACLEGRRDGVVDARLVAGLVAAIGQASNPG